ncbi:MAG TPA: PAS domain-containing protein, partial [Polyangiales bacterium]|nr:PAS domain-containing protein [Polyangiales bacterium]
MQNPDEENALRAENERLRERLSDLERRLARISAGGSSDYELTQAMNEREMLLAEAERIAHMGSWVWDVRTNHVTWSVDLFHILGYDPSRDVPSVAAFFARVHPDDIERVRAASQRVAATGQGRYIEYRLLLPGNVVRHVSTDGASVFDGAGVHLREVGIVLDRTAIAEATLELRRAHWLLEETQRSTRTGSWEWDPATGVVRWSRGLYELLGISPEMPATVERFERMLHPEDRAETLARRARLEQSDLSAVELPYVCRVQRGDGQCRKVQIVSDALRDERGEITMMIGTITDVTERSELEAQLRQSQKMEAVGQLAGGIAHDFNNLLTAILGYCNLMRDDMPAEDPLRADLDEIHTAGERAASLTRQLLAFSRRQMLQPQVVDMNSVVQQLEKLLRRLISENVELVTALARDLLSV